MPDAARVARSLRRLVLLALGASFGASLGATGAVAQTPPPTTVPLPPVRRPAQPPARPDTTRPDTTGRDSVPGAARGVPSTALVTWIAGDSIYDALISREGYRAVRYQGDTVLYRADQRVLSLGGRPAAVERDQTLLTGRSIVYNDSTQIVVASVDSNRGRGVRDSVVLRNPPQADVIVQSSIRYDLVNQSGTIRDFRTQATQGETWLVSGRSGAVVSDSTVQGGRIFYAHSGSITSCQDSIPHYHFKANDIKYVTKSLLVVRPAVLYIGDVPVLWLPFVFQDTRSGRRSGLLSPRFGVAELVRNNSNYRRSLENLGYYFNLGNYADAQAWFDWRSGSRGDSFDPGWLRFNAETQYRVITRFMQGRLSANYLAQRDGSRNTAISAQHEQSFNQNRRVSANINWVKSTTLQRQNSINPNAVLGTITSQLNYQDRFGPFQFSAGGTRKQYPGRETVDQDFPNLNLSARTISLASWLDWTPTASFSNSQSFNIDQGTQFDSLFVRDANGNVVNRRIEASRRNTNITFDTPLKIFDFQLSNGFRFTEDVQDYPQTRVVFRDIRDTSTRETRVFNQGFTSNLFYNVSFSLPSFLRGTWNVSPTVSLANVDPSFGLLVRTERTGGNWVAQTFRPAFGLSAAPTLYAFPPGLGPVERFRHSINPVFSFSMSPKATVSDDFLAAVGSTRQGYLGALPQSRVTMQLTSNLEAKLRRKAGDSASAGAGTGAGAGADKKVRLLSLNFTSLSYDFVIADSVGKSLFNKRGFVDNTWGYSAQSDLVPGLAFRANYSLFLGNPQSDTAQFKPFLTDVSASFSLDRNSALFAAIGKLFGISPSTPAGNSPANPNTTSGNPRGGDAFFSRQAVAQQVAGSGARNAPFDQPSTQSWQASFSFTSARQRPDIIGNLVTIDPTVQCQALRQVGNQIGYELCVARANTQQQTLTTTPGISTLGGAIYRVPPTKSLQVNTSFHLTPKWAHAMEHDVRRRAQRVREQRREPATRAARLARRLRVHAVAERQLRVQLLHRAQGAARSQVRLQPQHAARIGHAVLTS